MKKQTIEKPDHLELARTRRRLLYSAAQVANILKIHASRLSQFENHGLPLPGKNTVERLQALYEKGENPDA